MEQIPNPNTKRRHSCKVLSYHRILPEALVAEQITQKCLIVTAEDFRRQMLFVRKKYHVLTLDTLAATLAAGEAFPQPSCAITFDDGWRDNYQYAFPILKELGIPATLFATVNHIETGEDFWPERLTRLLLWVEPTTDNRNALEDVLQMKFNGSWKASRLEQANLAIIALKSRPLDEIEQLLSTLEHSTTCRRDYIRTGRSMCYWHELEELLNSKMITIGSHTLSHAILTVENEQRQVREISESKKILEEKLRVPIRHFAYPNGSFDSATEELVKNAGYRSACTCMHGVNNKAASPYRIRRIHIGHHIGRTGNRFSPLRFSFFLSDAFQQLRRVRHSLIKQAF